MIDAASPAGVRRAPAPGAAIECAVRPVAAPPLHVAFALGGTDLGRSGIGTYVREVLPPLITAVGERGGRLTAFGHPTELAAFADALEGATRRQVGLLPFSPGPNALWHLVHSGAFAQRLCADVLLFPAASRRIARWSPVPTVGVVHDLAQLRIAKKYDWLRMTYFRRVLVPAFSRPTRLVAISAATRDDLIHAAGVPADRIHVVYNGVNTTVFQSVSPRAVTEARAAVRLGGEPYLLYPARLEHPGKNHVRLLRAFARSGVAATHRLAFSGADWGAGPSLRALVTELNLDARVAFLGFVPGPQLPALVRGADAVLMLGLHEGFGLPPLEALSAGRPVCVAQTGALPEVVGEFGVQCDPFDEASIAEGLRRIVRDEAVRANCATGGPRWAAQFTWTRTAQGLLAVCEEAVG